ncbi:phospholipid phosphatase-related protein type 5-like [Pollicipes pollicipes]|uniref:phospholipid phosphatase-related protein type 5-like n=1 Tax=Pollicipes pollicipes TaxID=41117 RepID=UPI0018854623|nr:phospholipid phosphatase-related protein type 5-like [Pollicipes pollicipes]
MGDHPVNHVMVPLFLLEVVVTGCLAVIFYYLKYLDNFKEKRYPLPCADVQWISYPYYNDTDRHPLYLNDSGLYSASFFIPVVTIVIVEIIHWFFYDGEKKAITTNCPNWTFHYFTRRLIRITGTLLFGMLLTMVLTFTLKYVFVVPRPHFLQACQPNSSAISAICGGDIYTERLSTAATFTPSSVTCLAGAHAVDAALRSFPSEHAALPVFCGVFLACYLHQMVSFRRLVTVRPALVTLALLGGLLPGIGSLHLFRCRWSDLLAGYLLGAAVAFYLTEITLRRFAVAERSQPPATLLSLSQPLSSGVARSGISDDPEERLFQSAALESGGPLGIPRARQPARVFEAANKTFFP